VVDLADSGYLDYAVLKADVNTLVGPLQAATTTTTTVTAHNDIWRYSTINERNSNFTGNCCINDLKLIHSGIRLGFTDVDLMQIEILILDA